MIRPILILAFTLVVRYVSTDTSLDRHNALHRSARSSPRLTSESLAQRAMEKPSTVPPSTKRSTRLRQRAVAQSCSLPEPIVLFDPLEEQRALYIDQGATILAARSERRRRQYDLPEPNPWDQYQDFGHSHWHNSLIWGENLENISILGPGRIWGKGFASGGSRARRSRTTHSKRGPIQKLAHLVIQMRAMQLTAGETRRSV